MTGGWQGPSMPWGPPGSDPPGPLPPRDGCSSVGQLRAAAPPPCCPPGPTCPETSRLTMRDARRWPLCPRHTGHGARAPPPWNQRDSSLCDSLSPPHTGQGPQGASTRQLESGPRPRPALGSRERDQDEGFLGLNREARRIQTPGSPSSSHSGCAGSAARLPVARPPPIHPASGLPRRFCDPHCHCWHRYYYP